ncbi:CoA transferase [Bradyrhizobium lablabi]|uniref:CaiB/BaiF CoA transferase family protein n=1 Tax=Bradyrhizobium lablabi TaxID=722472 RepID=UPI001BABBB91|nr:CoA transferase [Bradyrhizobium lablabi]MBR1125672.1 CoA transferase [Bradyrhizobium lablabi]
MAGVLQGLKVVEFTHMVAGPACGQVLGDFGAEITKVEPPQGDITRRIGPKAGDVAALYASTNRNKKAVCIDITDPAGAAKARQLALQADVVISNLDTAMLKRAGLDGASLRRDEPSLICVEITGFGQGGPAGTDGLAQAAMGLMATTGAVEGPTFRTGPSVVDVSTGVWAALGVMAALENRRVTGQGDFIQASLADVCLYMQYPHITMYGAAPEMVRRNGNHSVVSCTPKFEVADGMIQVTVLHQRHWQALCQKVGAPELADDPRFAGNDQRCDAQGLIEQLLNPLMRKRRRHEWVELLRAAKLPCGPERDYSEVTVDAELHARGMLYHLPSGDGGSLQVRMPLEFATTQRAEPQAPPPLAMTPEQG